MHNRDISEAPLLRGTAALPRETAPRETRTWAVGLCLSLLAAAGISWLRYALAGTLKLHDDGLGTFARIALQGAFGICAVAAGVCYLRAVRSARSPSVATTLAVAFAAAACAASALPFTSSDAFLNLVYGRLARAGFNPFTTPPTELGASDPSLVFLLPAWTHMKFVYGPLIAAADSLAGRANGIAAQLVAFKVEMLVLAAVSLAMLPIFRKRASILFFAWNPLFLWEIAGQAHNDVVMLLPELGFVAAALAGYEWLALFCLVAAFCAKFSVAPLLGLYLVYIARRSPKKAALMAAAAVAIGALFFAPWGDGLSVLLAPLPEVRPDAHHHARSFTSLLCWLATPLGSEAQTQIYGASRILSSMALLALAVRAGMRAKSVESTLREGLIFLLAYELLFAAWFQSWYVIWLLPLAMVDRDERVRLAVAVYSVLSLVQYGLELDPVTYLLVNGLPLVMLLRLRTASSTDRSEAPAVAQSEKVWHAA